MQLIFMVNMASSIDHDDDDYVAQHGGHQFAAIQLIPSHPGLALRHISLILDIHITFN